MRFVRSEDEFKGRVGHFNDTIEIATKNSRKCQSRHLNLSSEWFPTYD